MRKTSLFRKVAKSFAGRLVCRLMGEEKGAVMLEYILVSLLVAAAAACGVAMYGVSISDMYVLLSEVSCNNITAENTGFDALLNDYQGDEGKRATPMENVGEHLNKINKSNNAGQSKLTPGKE